MGRSFVFGVIVASVTWAISLYLYWMLTTNPEVHNANQPQAQPLKSLVWKTSKQPEHETRNDGDDNHELLSTKRLKEDDPYKAKVAASSKDRFREKMRRYKKEQQHRRISQQLADELRPHQVEINGMI